MDPKKLEYLCQATALTQRQLCWVLFVSHFNFTITHYSGTQNKTTNALSLKEEYLASQEPPHLKSPRILKPQNVLDVMIPQDLMSLICSVTGKEPRESKPGAPPDPGWLAQCQGLLVRSAGDPPQLEVLWLCHDTPLAVQLGCFKTLCMATHSFCWPQKCTAIHSYAGSCETCARTKMPCSKPLGTLLPSETLSSHYPRLHSQAPCV